VTATKGRHIFNNITDNLCTLKVLLTIVRRPSTTVAVTQFCPTSITAQDVGTTIGLVVLAAISWLLPWRWHKDFASLVGKPARLAIESSTGTTARIAALRGSSEAEAEQLLVELAAEDLRATMELLRCYRPPGQFPTVNLTGVEHIETGLETGRGVILWVGHFVHNPLTSKVAMSRAGYRVHHLSHPRHGFSSSQFGMRYLNKVRTAAENRYLAERVTLALDTAKPALSRLRGCLEKNRIISMGARATGSRPLRVPFMKGAITLAPGAPVMALKTGATLLPAIPVREASGLQMSVGAPLVADSVQALAEAYMDYSAPYVTRFPSQWLGWLHLDH
jgi:lauroyl/myristoyl acyltransferase